MTPEPDQPDIVEQGTDQTDTKTLPRRRDSWTDRGAVGWLWARRRYAGRVWATFWPTLAIIVALWAAISASASSSDADSSSDDALAAAASAKRTAASAKLAADQAKEAIHQLAVARVRGYELSCEASNDSARKNLKLLQVFKVPDAGIELARTIYTIEPDCHAFALRRDRETRKPRTP